MNLWLCSSTRRAARPGANQPAAFTSVCAQDQCQIRGKFQLYRSSRALSWHSLLLGLKSLLAVLLFLAAIIPSVRAQTSVTLAWDPSSSSGIAAYRLYQGGASRTYTNVIAAGNATTATTSKLVNGSTYFFTVTAVDTNGLESDFSNEITYTVPLPTNTPPAIVLTSPANGAVYIAPATISLAASVTANGHTISQVQFYNGATLLGTATATPYTFSWPNVSAGTYGLSAKLVYDSGSSTVSAAANITVAAARPNSGLTFAADSGSFSGPFVDSNGMLSQSVSTDVTSGGQAVYTFDIAHTGNYEVSAMVIAPSLSQNSFYVNIDSAPTDPLMIWDVPVCTNLTSLPVSWRGSGTGDPASSQYSPKVFSLSAGTHQLFIIGREANTTLGAISITALPPKLKIGIASGMTGNMVGVVPPPQPSVVLSVMGLAGLSYNVLWSKDLVTWTVIGTLTLDDTGAGQFTDPAGTSRPRSFYRLLDIALTPPKLQIRASTGGPVVLSGTGPAGGKYYVQCTEDIKVWTVIGTVTPDVNGSFTFTDPAGNSRPRCLYRLQQQ
jgi:hypothetical protein